MAEMLRLTFEESPVFVDPAKIDAIYFCDYYTPANGTSLAVNGVIVRVSEHPDAVHTAMQRALSREDED